MAFARGAWRFHALRFALGVAEAGFMRGVVLHVSYWVSYWFPAHYRARAIAIVIATWPKIAADK
jgi:hypothetical protein